MVVGPVYLIYATFKDCFYFVKILCDTKDDEGVAKEKEEEDFKNDKIIIFNEIMDVMKSIMLLFNKKKDENGRRKSIFQDPKKNKLLAKGLNDFDESESYIMEKKLIVEAWSKYRPNSAENSPVNSDEGRK